MIDVGAVRIAGEIGEGVVLAMVGDPGDDGPFDRGGAERGEHSAQERARLEAAMREQTVEADRHPEADREVGDREHDQVRPMQRLVPRLPHGKSKEQDRRDRDDPGDRPIQTFVQARLNIAQGRTLTLRLFSDVGSADGAHGC